ncbi:hypothetical protein D3C87_1095060 [compost metagenome]
MIRPALGSVAAGALGWPGGNEVGAGNTTAPTPPTMPPTVLPTPPTTLPTVVPTPPTTLPSVSLTPPTTLPTVVPTPPTTVPSVLPTPLSRSPTPPSRPREAAVGDTVSELVCATAALASTSFWLRSAASTAWASASTFTAPATPLFSVACTASSTPTLTVSSLPRVAVAETRAVAPADSVAGRSSSRLRSAAPASTPSAAVACTAASGAAATATFTALSTARRGVPPTPTASVPAASTPAPGTATCCGTAAFSAVRACTSSSGAGALAGLPRLSDTLASALSAGVLSRSRTTAASAASASSFTGSGAYLAVSASRSLRVWRSPASAVPLHSARARPMDSSDSGTFRCTTTGPATRLPREVATSETTTRAFSRWLQTSRKIRFIRCSPVYGRCGLHPCLLALGGHYSRHVIGGALHSGSACVRSGKTRTITGSGMRNSGRLPETCMSILGGVQPGLRWLRPGCRSGLAPASACRAAAHQIHDGNCRQNGTGPTARSSAPPP